MITKHRAFTLLELLVTFAIIGFISTVALAAVKTTQANSRSNRRLEDLKTVAKALELYYNDHQAYPSTSTPQNGRYTLYDCYDSRRYNDYIPGLASQYLSRLPHDPITTCTGNRDYNYAYTSDGKDYKFFAPMVPNCPGQLENCALGKKYGVEDPVRTCGMCDKAWSVYTPAARNW